MEPLARGGLTLAALRALHDARWVIAFALVVFGVLGYQTLPINLLPSLDIPIVTVITSLPGASPEVMESDVTDVIEEYTRPARYVEAGKVVTAPALSEPELLDFPTIGTLGAFIRLKAPVTNRRALLDIGAAGVPTLRPLSLILLALLLIVVSVFAVVRRG